MLWSLNLLVLELSGVASLHPPLLATLCSVVSAGGRKCASRGGGDVVGCGQEVLGQDARGGVRVRVIVGVDAFQKARLRGVVVADGLRDGFGGVEQAEVLGFFASILVEFFQVGLCLLTESESLLSGSSACSATCFAFF